jgi:polysaccharide pyruvyl transferase WcaK-like protein
LPSEFAEVILRESVGKPRLVAICPHFFSLSHEYRVHHYDQFRSDEIDRYYSVLAQVCDRLLERTTLLFLPMNTEEPDSDLVAIQAIRERMERGQEAMATTAEISPAQIVTVLRSCRLVLGTRLHSLVFASATRTPMVAISYGPKIDGFMETLGLEAHSHRLKELSATALWTSVDHIWKQYEQFHGHLRQRMIELETLAAANADRAVSLLTIQNHR